MNSKNIAFVVLSINFLLWLAVGWSNSTIGAENGWLESFQAICLAVGGSMFAAAILRADNRLTRLLFAGLALFYLNFLLREINVRNFGLSDSTVYFLGGTGRNWILGIGWLILSVFFLRWRKEMPRTIFSWVKTLPGLFLILAGAFYLAGVPFDKKIFGLTNETHELFEEILETQASLLMLLAAIFSLFGQREPRQIDNEIR